MLDDFLRGKKLNKDIPIPLYYQLKELLLEYITSSKEQTPLPTESQLCDHFQVSRSTVRQALGELTSDGFLVRHKGKGTMILPRKIDQDFLVVLESFNDEMHEKGLIPRTKVLSLSLTQAPHSVSDALQIEKDTEVVQLVRLRSADDMPMVLVTSFLPAGYRDLGRMVDEDLEQHSLYKLMEQKYGVPIESSRRIIEIRMAGDFEASHLQIPVHAPLQYIETVSTSLDGVPVEYSKASYRGDLSRFVIEIRKKKI
jgi:GntR family transcriptional regulator